MRWRWLRRQSSDSRGRTFAVPRRITGSDGGDLALMLILTALCLPLGRPVLTRFLGTAPVAGPARLIEATEATGWPQTQAPPGERARRLAVAALDRTETRWRALFSAVGRNYAPPSFEWFTADVQTGCGLVAGARGTFYCPLERRIYVETSFLRDLAMAGSGEGPAVAYVVGHEVGHHVQNLMGTLDNVRGAARSLADADATRLAVALELQADCFAGVAAYRGDLARTSLPIEVERAVAAPAVVNGPQSVARTAAADSPSGAGEAGPIETLTHGSSTLRQRWLQIGLRSGDPLRCDTSTAW
jgi:uncharacterized protein